MYTTLHAYGHVLLNSQDWPNNPGTACPGGETALDEEFYTEDSGQFEDHPEEL